MFHSRDFSPAEGRKGDCPPAGQAARPERQRAAASGTAREAKRMGTVVIKIPLVTWRDGRPRFIPGPSTAALGFKGEDLRHGKAGPWFTLDEAIAWSRKRQAELAARRAAIAAGETTAKRTAREVAGERAAGQVTVGRVVQNFLAGPRLQGKPIVEGKRRREPLAPDTVRNYRLTARVLEQFDDGEVWNAPADDLSGRALAGILEGIEVARGLAQARAVRGLVSVAFRNGLGRTHRRNPAAELEVTLPMLDEDCRPGSVAEIRQLVAVADTLGFPDAGDLIVAGVWTGQRQTDRLSVCAPDLGADGILFAPSKKKKKKRLLVPVAAALSARRTVAKARRKGWRVQPLALFPCELTGRAWKRDWWQKVMRIIRVAAATGDAERQADGSLSRDAAKVLKGRDVKALLTGAGIEPMPSLADWTDKHCRDTCLSWLALAGADDFEIAGFSGHAFGEDKRILKHYVAVPPEFARRGMVKLEAWYAAQCGALENASGTESLT